MAAFPTLRYIITLCLLIFPSTTESTDPNSSFNFQNFGEISNFNSQFALYGEANVINGGSAVQISGGSPNSTAGGLIYKKPIKLVQGIPKILASFSTDFSFSFSRENGGGLAFSMFPNGFPLNVSNVGREKIRVIMVKFATVVDLQKNHIISVKLNNLSSMNLALNSSEKLRAWINYEAGSKRFEIRLAKFGELKPLEPLHSYPIDFSQLWKQEDVFMGLSSSSVSDVYSWLFELRRAPKWMHSEPLDPEAFAENARVLSVHKRSNCVLRVIIALVFGTGCGALGALFVVLIWSLFIERRPVIPEECVEDKGVEFELEKFKVDVGDCKK